MEKRTNRTLTRAAIGPARYTLVIATATSAQRSNYLERVGNTLEGSLSCKEQEINDSSQTTVQCCSYRVKTVYQTLHTYCVSKHQRRPHQTSAQKLLMVSNIRTLYITAQLHPPRSQACPTARSRLIFRTRHLLARRALSVCVI